MTPVCVVDYISYNPGLDPEGFCQAGSAFTLGKTLPNLAYVVICKTCAWMRFTWKATRNAPAFCVHVPHIIEGGSNEEMVGIRARRIVTFMQNIQAVWYRAIVEFVGETVSDGKFFTVPKLCVTMAVGGCQPRPTLIGASVANLLPKTYGGWTCKAMVIYVTQRLAFYVSEPFVGVLGEFGFLPTATSAVTKWNFVKSKLRLGKFWGMLRHVDYLLRVSAKAWGDLRSSPGTFYWSCYHSILAHLNEYGNEWRLKC